MKLLSLARDLRRRKARERDALFVVEGVRAVEELLQSGLAIRGVLWAPQLAEAPRGAALQTALTAREIRLESITPMEFASAAETESPQGVLAIAEIPARSFTDIGDKTGPVLILDGVQDPGNVGTILRTAAALGAAATLALPGTVDLWNAKVVRSAVGAHFTHVAFAAAWNDVSRHLAESDTTLWAAAADGDRIETLPRPRRVAIAVGNEGAGVSATVAGAARARVAVPITAAVESLNVAVATGILLYELGRQ